MSWIFELPRYISCIESTLEACLCLQYGSEVFNNIHNHPDVELLKYVLF